MKTVHSYCKFTVCNAYKYKCKLCCVFSAVKIGIYFYNVQISAMIYVYLNGISIEFLMKTAEFSTKTIVFNSTYILFFRLRFCWV